MTLAALSAVLLAALTPVVATHRTATITTPRIEASACPAALPAGFQCGVLTVPERADGSGPALMLPFAVRQAGPTRSADALTFLNGGPGLSAMRAAPTVAAALAGLAEDMVFLERRGLGLARPAFSCPPGTRRWTGRWDIPAALRCRDRWRAAGFDLNEFDTVAAARDLDTLRRLLGYRRWDLFGISYGTAYALATMRDYPGSVRSALLDSVYPYGLDPFADSAAKYFDAFDRLFADCAADRACAAGHPALKRTLIAAVDRARTRPLVTPAGALGARALLARIAHALQETVLLPVLPAMVDAAARGDGTTFARLDAEADPSAAPAAGFPEEAIAVGIWPTIECRERFPLHRRAPRRAAGWPASIQALLDAEWGPGDTALCRAWGVRAATAGLDAPIAAAIPTLILIGERDPQITPAWAARAAALLPTGAARVAVVPGSAHVATLSACGGALAREFLAAPSQPLNGRCTAQPVAIRFEGGQ